MIVPDRDDWYVEAHGFPRPQWSMIEGWMRVYVPRDDGSLHEAWQQLVRHWLGRLAKRLGAGYAVAESAHFHLLAEGTVKEREATLTFLESTRRHIEGVLGDISIPKGPGKHVVLSFAELDHYYHYIAAGGQDGEQAASGGMFLNDGYLHIALPDCFGHEDRRATCAHELSHNLLAHLPLPMWLNEALAMAFEADVAGDSYELTGEVVDRHRHFWNADTVQGFWDGSEFYAVDGQELSYGLARILLRLIHEDIRPSREDFRRFVLRADRSDAGAVAAREHLGIELEELMNRFLGPGDWSPKPGRWKHEVREKSGQDEEN